MEQPNIPLMGNLLEGVHRIVVVPHRNPDGDAMGATLACTHILRQLGYEVLLMSPNAFPDFLAWMPGAEQVWVYETQTEFCQKWLDTADMVFTLDFNALHRVGDRMGAALQAMTVPFAMIDHHEAPDAYARYTFSDTTYGSSCQMVFDWMEAHWGLSYLTPAVATCLYTGIMTDSGSFRFPKTTARTHRVVAQLLEAGAPNTAIHQQVFDSYTPQRLQLLGMALSKLKVVPELGVAYTYLTEAEMQQCHAQKGDTEGFVNYGLSLQGMTMAAIFIEKSDENLIKISLRSKGKVDVNQLSRQFFEGGGHIHAAGGKSHRSMAETLAYFEHIIHTHPLAYE